jgi:DNA-binding transcriptional ArsR family regulator
MIDDAARTQRMLSCLGGPSRYRLVRELLDGERCVSDLAAGIGLSQSCTTRHLQALERERLVVRARDGKRVMVRLRLEEPGVPALLDLALQRGAAVTSHAVALPGGGSFHRDGVPPARTRPHRPRRRPSGSPKPQQQAPADAPPRVASIPAPATEAVTPATGARARPARGDIEDFLL